MAKNGAGGGLLRHSASLGALALAAMAMSLPGLASAQDQSRALREAREAAYERNERMRAPDTRSQRPSSQADRHNSTTAGSRQRDRGEWRRGDVSGRPDARPQSEWRERYQAREGTRSSREERQDRSGTRWSDREDGRSRERWRTQSDGYDARQDRRNRPQANTWGRHDQTWRSASRDRRDWDRGWRSNSRYDWSGYRTRNRSVFHAGRYYAPHASYRYRRIGVGFTLGTFFYGQRYWISDPWSYRLPDVYGPYRWVRYYDDVLLVDIYSGRVVDVVHDFFW